MFIYDYALLHIIMKKCIYCGIEFIPSKFTPHHQKFCSRKCRQNEHREKKRDLINAAFGDTCFVCGTNKNPVLHRKDGKQHAQILLLNMKKLLNLIKNDRDKYLLLCKGCHRFVHWSINHPTIWKNIPTFWEKFTHLVMLAQN